LDAGHFGRLAETHAGQKKGYNYKYGSLKYSSNEKAHLISTLKSA
jgi:hypothetical protein